MQPPLSRSTARIRTVAKLPGKVAAEHPIADELQEMQRFVGGYLEALMTGRQFFDDGATLVILGDEDARGKDPTPATNVRRPTDGVMLLGPLLAVKIDGQGNNVSMTEADAATVIELFNTLRSS